MFGIVPRLPVRLKGLPGQQERLLAAQKARAEVVRHLAQSRLSTAVRSNVPRSSERDIQIGMNVLYYWERPLNLWTGQFQFKVVAIDGEASLDKQHRWDIKSCLNGQGQGV